MDTDFRTTRGIFDGLHLRVFATGYSRFLPGTWNARDVRDSFWRFYINDRPGMALEIADGFYELEGGRPYFVPAGVRFNCLNVAVVTHFHVHFDVMGLPPVALNTLFGAPIALAFDAGLGEAAWEAGLLMGRGRADDLGWQCRIKALLYQGLAQYLESIPAEQVERIRMLAAAYEPLLPALTYIEGNVAAHIRNRELAVRCGLSEDHFIRRFRENIGISPAQYVLQCRINVAAQRLLFTQLSIEQIAADSGFGNRFYFTRAFGRQMGVSPAAYRKRLRV